MNLIILLLVLLLLFGGLGGGYMHWHPYGTGPYNLVYIILIVCLILFLLGGL